MSGRRDAGASGGRWTALFREPLVPFLALGLAIFGLHAWRGPSDPDRIVVRRGQIEAEQLARLGRRATPEEVEQAVLRAAEQAALLREAHRLGLDQQDPIIERRLVQKMELLAEDLATLKPPSEPVLEDYLRQHAARYRRPELRTLQQVYLRAGPASARAAQDILGALRSGRSAEGLGDPFPAGHRFEARSEETFARTVGVETARAAFESPGQIWSGPFTSVYGLHLVRTSSVVPGRAARLEEVRARVRSDYERAHREAAIREARQRALSRYEVEVRP